VLFRGEDASALALASLKRFLAELAKSYRVYLLLDNPQDQRFDPKKILVQQRLAYLFSAVMPQPLAQALPVAGEQLRLNQTLKQIGIEAGVEVIDQIGPLCPGQECPTVDGTGQPIHKDGDHLRSRYVAGHADYLDAIFKQP
jgi:hypothetical protein